MPANRKINADCAEEGEYGPTIAAKGKPATCSTVLCFQFQMCSTVCNAKEHSEMLFLIGFSIFQIRALADDEMLQDVDLHFK
jgi:hypothetical protein